MNNSSSIYIKKSLNSQDLLGLLKENQTGFYLESTLGAYNLGRFSFFGIEPFMTIQLKDGLITKCQEGKSKSYKGNIFEQLRLLLNQSNKKAIDHYNTANTLVILSYITGGIGGFCFGYPIGKYLQTNEFETSDYILFGVSGVSLACSLIFNLLYRGKKY